MKFRPVTMPNSSTVAMLGLPEDQVTSRMEAFSGAQAAVSCSVDPAATFRFPASIWIFFTGWITSTRKVSVTSGFRVLATTRSHSPCWIARMEDSPALATPASVVV